MDKQPLIMNRFIRQSIYFFVILFAFACNQKPIPQTLIPAYAKMVVAFDFKKLSGKAVELKDLLNPDMITGNPNSKDFLVKITNTGFDYKKPAYIFMWGDMSPSQPELKVGISFYLNSASKFESAITKDAPDTKVEKIKKRRYVFSNNYALAWEGKKALFVAIPGQTRQKLQSAVDELFAQKAEDCLEKKNDEFQAVLQRDADICFWMDYKGLYAKMAEEMKQLPEMKDITEDAKEMMGDMFKLTENITGIMNFEKGNVKAQSKTTFNPELLKKYRDLIRDKIDGNLIEATPIENPALFTSAAVGLKGIQRILDKLNLLRQTKTLTLFLGVTIDELFEMLSGDVVFALKDIKPPKTPDKAAKADTTIAPPLFEIPDINFSLGLGIQKREILDKVLKNVSDLYSGFRKKGDYYILSMSGFEDFYFAEKGNILLITMNEDIQDAFRKGSPTLKSEFVQLGKGNLSAMYIDFQKIFAMIPPSFFGTSQGALIKEKVMPEFLDMNVSTPAFSDNTSLSEMTLNIKDKNRNSLVVLIEIFKTIQKENNIISMQ
jgi:Domain of unknown function (DUF4836)